MRTGGLSRGGSVELNQIPAKKEKVDYPHFIMEGFGPININVGNPNKNFPTKIFSKRKTFLRDDT